LVAGLTIVRTGPLAAPIARYTAVDFALYYGNARLAA
jgi:hypothetical protein